MRNLLIISCVIGSLCIFSCNGTKKTGGASPEKASAKMDNNSSEKPLAKEEEKKEKVPEKMHASTDDSLVVSLRRTACYGTCPIYEIKVYKSGYATYEGKRFVDNIGKFHSRIGNLDIKAITDKALEIKYFDLNDEYLGSIQDFPSCITSVKVDGKDKTIKSRHGMPEELTSFEKFFDSKFSGVNWEKVGE